METLQCIKTRRSIRKFLDKPVPDELVNELIDCARHAPAAYDCQSWEFVVVKDAAAKDELASKLAKIQPYSKFIKGAPVVIVVCFDQTKTTSSPSDIFNPALAAQNLLLAATDQGLGLPKHIGVICVIPVGYPDEALGARKLRPIGSMVHVDKWPRQG